VRVIIHVPESIQNDKITRSSPVVSFNLKLCFFFKFLQFYISRNVETLFTSTCKSADYINSIYAPHFVSNPPTKKAAP